MIARGLAVLALVLLAACSAPAPQPVDRSEIAALDRELRALGAEVSAAEAARAAEIALVYSRQLAVEYGVTDPPLIHNTKVNMGLRPRGLCWHWADDLEARLRAEGFATLALHRAIANSDNALRIEHSTVIVSASGAPMAAGVVLDPWRAGGDLYWSPVVEDTAYRWQPRTEVLATRRARQVSQPSR